MKSLASALDCDLLQGWGAQEASVKAWSSPANQTSLVADGQKKSCLLAMLYLRELSIFITLERGEGVVAKLFSIPTWLK